MALVAAPHLPEEEHDRQLTTFEQMIADMGGVVHKVERWGRRKLAYPLKKCHEGNYTLLLYDASPEVEREFIRRLKLSDNFLRFLSVRADHQKPPTAEEKAALEQARRDYLARAQERAAQGALGPEEPPGPPGLVEETLPPDEGEFGEDVDLGPVEPEEDV
jgi:small subunit ribosomal protein S6